MYKARIENWVLLPEGRLYGEIYDHPKFDNGVHATTSKVVIMKRDDGLAYTQNTVYTLGREQSSFDSWHKALQSWIDSVDKNDNKGQ